MAKKYFEMYYVEVCAQYHEMNNDIKEMELQVQEGMVKPEFLDKLKTMIAPIFNNWRTVNYIKFLLDMPVKKEKSTGYIKRNKEFLKNCKQKDEIKSEGDDVLNQLKNIDFNS